MAENKSVTGVIYSICGVIETYIYIYIIYMYLEPKRPLFWLERPPFGELTKTKIEIIWALHFPTGDFLPTFYGTCHDLPRPMPAQKLPNWLHWPISKRRLTQATASCRWLNGLPGTKPICVPYLAKRHRPRNNKETGNKAAQVEHMMVLYLIPLSIFYMISLSQTKSLDLIFLPVQIK